MLPRTKIHVCWNSTEQICLTDWLYFGFEFLTLVNLEWAFVSKQFCRVCTALDLKSTVFVICWFNWKFASFQKDSHFYKLGFTLCNALILQAWSYKKQGHCYVKVFSVISFSNILMQGTGFELTLQSCIAKSYIIKNFMFQHHLKGHYYWAW